MIENFIELHKQINDWKKQRGLTIKMQREGLIKNLREEIMELIDSENKDDFLNALCDISILCIGVLRSVNKIKIEECMWSVNALIINYNTLKKEFSNKNLFYLIASCKAGVENADFDYFKCMQETIKEISSRTGKYDDEAKKWIKDTSDEAKTKWYKADYSKCKRS